MSNGKLGRKDVSFNITVQDIRRKHMMQALTGEGESKASGMKILNNVGK